MKGVNKVELPKYSEKRIHPGPTMWAQLAATWKCERYDQQREAGLHSGDGDGDRDQGGRSPSSGSRKRKVVWGPKLSNSWPHKRGWWTRRS